MSAEQVEPMGPAVRAPSTPRTRDKATRTPKDKPTTAVDRGQDRESFVALEKSNVHVSFVPVQTVWPGVGFQSNPGCPKILGTETSATPFWNS